MSHVPFRKLDSETTYRGILGHVRIEHFRHDDGEVVEREVIGHPGAVGVVAYDDEHVWLVRQPREAIGRVTLELPAGKLDVEGETPLQCGQRELAEEIGKAAAQWEPLISMHTSPGFSDEVVELFVATGLSEAHAEPDEGERIEIVPWPLATLDAAIAETVDAKTLVGLLMLAQRLRA